MVHLRFGLPHRLGSTSPSESGAWFGRSTSTGVVGRVFSACGAVIAIGITGLGVSTADFFQRPAPDCSVDDLVGAPELKGEVVEELEKVRVGRGLRDPIVRMVRFSDIRDDFCEEGDADIIAVSEDGPASARR